MISWKCRFGWHAWTKWSSMKEGKAIGTGTFNKGEERPAVIQARYCTSCNKYQVQEVDQ